jgi:hypothetical protein
MTAPLRSFRLSRNGLGLVDLWTMRSGLDLSRGLPLAAGVYNPETRAARSLPGAWFNAKSVVLSPEMKGKGRWVELDSGSSKQPSGHSLCFQSALLHFHSPLLGNFAGLGLFKGRNRETSIHRDKPMY